jgi:hypothetical protein
MAAMNAATTGLRVGAELRHELIERMIARIRDRSEQSPEDRLERMIWTEEARRENGTGPDPILRVSDPSPMRWMRLM